MDLGQAQQGVQRVLDAIGLARAHIVNLARRAVVEQEFVSPHHISHVCEVARRFEVADVKHGLARAGLHLGELARETR